MAGNSRVLTVRILSDASGVGKGLTNASNKFESFGKAIGLKSNSSGMNVGNKLVGGIDKVLGTGLKIAGAAGAAVLGTTLFKGFQRFKAIDQAKAQFRGLGYTTKEITGIMKNAEGAVLGTAFSLADAATQASKVMAAGIQPGKELQSTLALVADAATLTGSSLDDMGDIFATVAAKNKLQGDTLNRLQTRGLDVLGNLAKFYGVTRDAASDMVTQGKVDFADFSAAMEKGIGGSAKSAGDTFQGAWDNVMIALGRIGEAFLTPLLTTAKDGLKGLPALLKPITSIAADAGESLSKMLNWLSKNVGVLKTLGIIAGTVLGAVLLFRGAVAVMQLWQGALVVVKAVQAVATGVQWAWNAAMAAGLGPVLLIIAIIAVLVGVFILLWNKCEGFRNFWIGLWKGIQAVVAGVVDWLRSAWQSVVSWLSSVWSGYMSAWSTIWSTAKGVVDAVVSWFRNAWNTVIGWLKSYVQTSVGVFSSVFGTVRTVVSSVTGFFRSAWEGAVSTVSKVVRTLQDIFTSVFRAILRPIEAVVDAFRNAIGWVQNLIGWISKIKIPSLGAIGKAIGLSAAAPVAYAGGPGLSRMSVGALAAPTRAPDLASILAGTGIGATGGGNVTIINVEGGLDSADTIARRLERVLTDRDRRNRGVTIGTRAA